MNEIDAKYLKDYPKIELKELDTDDSCFIFN